MKVVVVAINSNFGDNLVTQVFSTQEKADKWLETYVRDNWSEHYDECECPTDGDEAVNEYFNGDEVEDEILSIGVSVVDEV